MLYDYNKLKIRCIREEASRANEELHVMRKMFHGYY